MTDNLQQVHDDWKKKGFPFYPTNQKWRDEIFNQLVNFRRDTLIDRIHLVADCYSNEKMRALLN